MATNRIAKPVKGLGIVTPSLIPPILAALTATILTSFFLLPVVSNFIMAYANGTLDALIGADILNIQKIKDLGAPVASIGGEGTFDGVFLAKIIAVLLIRRDNFFALSAKQGLFPEGCPAMDRL